MIKFVSGLVLGTFGAWLAFAPARTSDCGVTIDSGASIDHAHIEGGDHRYAVCVYGSLTYSHVEGQGVLTTLKASNKDNSFSGVEMERK